PAPFDLPCERELRAREDEASSLPRSVSPAGLGLTRLNPADEINALGTPYSTESGPFPCSRILPGREIPGEPSSRSTSSVAAESLWASRRRTRSSRAV